MAKEKSLLEEAIAEAKRVREAAIADATKRLEENLTPSIKEMLASKLEEELDLEENEEESLDENANSGFKEVKPKSTVKEAEDDKPKDDEEEPADDAPADDDAPVDDAPADDNAEDAPADEEPAEGDPAAEEENDDDTPLKDITLGDLRTLIQDIVAAGQAPAEGGDLGADMDAGGVEGMGDEAPAGDLAATDAPEGEIEPAGEAGAEDMQDMPADNEDGDEEEIDISEILKELEDEEKGNKNVCPKCGKEHCICKENKANDIMPENPRGKEHHKEFTSGPSQDDELQELKKENAELKEGLAKCNKVLKDVNLLNSKLIYTTRVLNQKGLSEAQKVKAMKSLDEAKSPKEVKSIYNVLAESFKTNKSVIKEGRQASRASRAAGRSTAAPKEVITESNDMVRRFQQLAGIIKD